MATRGVHPSQCALCLAHVRALCVRRANPCVCAVSVVGGRSRCRMGALCHRWSWRFAVIPVVSGGCARACVVRARAVWPCAVRARVVCPRVACARVRVPCSRVACVREPCVRVSSVRVGRCAGRLYMGVRFCVVVHGACAGGVCVCTGCVWLCVVCVARARVCVLRVCACVCVLCERFVWVRARSVCRVCGRVC